mmetsp:Transcript_82371/g.176401  ORF Transcript_82371/g.176401 Transcript_82371/m.176401 type:complete len:221 (+) Transcript_82371:421-1083(+)
MSSVKTKRLTKAAASPRLWASGSQMRSTTGSNSSSARRPLAAKAAAHLTAGAPTAGSMSLQRARTRGRTCSARLFTAGEGTAPSPRNNSWRATSTAARAPASRSLSPKWRYFVQSGSAKASPSAAAQRRKASKQLRRTSGSASLVRRLRRVMPRLSRAAARSRAQALACSSSAVREAKRPVARCTSASLTWTSAVLQKSRKVRHCAPRPSTSWRPASAAA